MTRPWIVPALSLLLLLASTVAFAQATTPSVEPPVIVSFTADDADLETGQSTTLRWEVTGADIIVIDDGTQDLTIADDATSVTVTPSTTTTYTLTATSTGGDVEATVSVTVTDPVELVVESYIVSKVTRDDGTREDRYSPTTRGGRPGQVVEYRIIAINVSDETLPPGIVAIPVEIPEGTQFVPHSATPSSEWLLTEFSADNVTYSETHVFVGLGDNRTIADPTAYRWVRWTVLVDMEPGAELTLVFRVTIR